MSGDAIPFLQSLAPEARELLLAAARPISFLKGAVLVRHPQVRNLVCGHVHRPVQLSWHGLTASIGPSPSHAVALDLRPQGPSAFVLDPPACQIFHRTNDGDLVGHLSFIGDFDGPHPFFDASGALIE